MNTAKKPKMYHYHDEWEHDYFFVMVKDKCCCLICNNSVSLPKKGNVERHFKTVHSKYDTNYPCNSDLRKAKVKELKASLSSQQLFFTKQTSKSKAATIASLRVSHILAKNKKPFSDGAIYKKAFIEAADSLFSDFKNKSEIISSINEMQLSRNTIAKRVDEISSDLKDQLMQDIKDCQAFSLQLDESTDAIDISQLIVFIRMVFKDFSTKEEMLSIIPLKGKTRGEDIFCSFKKFIQDIQLPLFKLASITTDGAPALTGCRSGFIALCRNDEDFPDFLQYHCIIHQQVLCAKILNMKDIMDIAFKISNSIRAKSLQRRLFKLQIEESDNEVPSELLMHTDVRWLSRGKFLQRFRDLIDEIRQFLAEKGDNYDQLHDDVWLLDLAFLTDITAKLNELNLELQGPNKTIFHMISSVNAFKQKLNLLLSKLENKNLANFPNMTAQLNSSVSINYDKNRYVDEIRHVITEFNNRFQDFKKLDTVVLFMSFPFDSNMKTEEIAKNLGAIFDLNSLVLEEEIITLQSDVFVKARASEDRFWKYLSEDKYPSLRRCAENLYACFGSTYLCESAFSQMKIIKSKYRTVLTDDHLDSCLRNGLSTYIPNYSKILEKLHCRVSSASTSSQ